MDEKMLDDCNIWKSSGIPNLYEGERKLFNCHYRLFLQQVPKRVMKKEGLSQRAEPRTERVGLRVMVDNLQEIYSYEMSLGKMLHS